MRHVALFRGRDPAHGRIKTFLQANPCTLVTTWLVVTEAWHLLGEAAQLKLVRWIAAGGVAVLETRPEDSAAMLELLEWRPAGPSGAFSGRHAAGLETR